jgi:hypothetical protein
MNRPARSFNYVRRSREDILERANASSGDFDDYIKRQFKKYKVRDGKNLIRILPPTWEKPRHYGYEIWLHYGIGADNQTYLSLAKMKAEKDPLAEAYLEADRDGNEKLAKALRARKRMLMWVIDRQAEDEGPLLWAAPFTVDKDIATLSADEDTTEVLLIDEPAEGYDIRFHKEGKGISTEYPAAKIKLLGPSPLSDDEDKAAAWLQFVQTNPLPEVLNFYSYDHISQVFNGNVRMDETPNRGGTKGNAERVLLAPKGNGSPRGVETDDEDQEEKPAPSRRSLAPVDDEDEEGDLGQSIKARLARTTQAGRRRPVADDD